MNQFINETKIKTAQNILSYSDFSILNIALSLGFSSQSAFSASFKKVTGVSPKTYRDQNYNVNLKESEK